MKTDFAMVIHFHQPVGNFDHVIKRACDRCYRPFLEKLREYPDIKMSFHFTGCLLEWLEENDSTIIDMIKEMILNGQIEMISGGFYEPIIPSIPRLDALGQIKMLNDYIEHNLCFAPKGAWIAERVWEPHMASLLYDAGIKYIILDDTHFLYSGLLKNKTYGYYITEDDAKQVAVFPSDKVLRYYIPFKEPFECMEYMKKIRADQPNALFIYGDDGEKFGEWPGTYKWVFEEKWLENFFDELTANSSWLNTVKMSDCLEKRLSEGKIYLSTSSYEEMLEWSLPLEGQKYFKRVKEDIKNSGKEEFYKPFLRGGFWRNFMSKYPESDHMNKKMIYVSGKLKELKETVKEEDHSIYKEAEKELFKGQCNCAYWHGVFGGLYLFHLRKAIYDHLIKSESFIDEIRHKGEDFCEARVFDFDADGKDEVVFENKSLALYFSPFKGGVLSELDSKELCHNFINTLSRKEEIYHSKIKEKLDQEEIEDGVKTIHDDMKQGDTQLKGHLYYDRYNRYSLRDHFIGNDVDMTAFSRCEYDEKGDFANGIYEFDVKKSGQETFLTMEREGRVSGKRVLVRKDIKFPHSIINVFEVSYMIRLLDAGMIDLNFGSEFNVTMPEADSEKYSLVLDGEKKRANPGTMLQEKNIRKTEIRDMDTKLCFQMELSRKCDLWFFPVKTVSQSERSYELNYQSSVIFPHFKIKLRKNKEVNMGIAVSIVNGDQ
ncbi:MAG: alpha-amylase/4-alpha-glucanotransferase domain-containing protein [Candidatus Omnitrophota bacterium]